MPDRRNSFTSSSDRHELFRFVQRLTLFVGCVFLPVLIINYLIDPLQFFRKADPYQPAFYKEQRYQNPGLALNYDFDAVLLGTSMCENFSASQIDSPFGCKVLKLTMSGSSLYEQRRLLELALRQKPKMVFWGIESYTLDNPPQKTADEYGFPEYLFNDHGLDDIHYLFDPVMLRRSVGIMTGTIYRKYKAADELGRWGQKIIPVPLDTLLHQYHDSARMKKVERFVGVMGSSKEHEPAENMMQNLIPVIRDNPDILFNIFLTPPSALFHARLYGTGRLATILSLREKLVRECSPFPNARIFDFESDTVINNDLSLYADLNHYWPFVNRSIASMMSKGEKKVNEYEIIERNLILQNNARKVFERNALKAIAQ